MAFRVSRLKKDSAWDWTLARDCPQAIGTVCPRLLWRRYGFHTPTFEHFADFVAAHAHASTCDRGFAVAVQHQLDGRPDEAVLHDGSCSSRRAICRSWNHGSCTNNRRLHPADVCRANVCETAFDQHSVLHRRNAEDRLRPSALSTIRGDPTTRRESPMIRDLTMLEVTFKVNN